MLKTGDVFKTVAGDVWYVESVGFSRAYCIHLSAHPGPITTRKGFTKIVKRHLRNAAFSLDSLVDLVDPSKLDQLQLKRRLTMARKEAEGTMTEGSIDAGTAPTRVPAPRQASRYVRTDKAPAKEVRGQAKEVLDAYNVAAGQPLNADEIAARCVFAGSRQDKVRVAAFYIAQFKKDGLIAPAPVTETVAETVSA